MTLTQLLLVAVPGLPILMAMGLAAAPLRPTLRALLPIAALPALALVAMPGPVLLAEPWLMLGGEFGLTTTARAFLAFSALLWALASWAAVGWMRDDPNAAGFSACFLLAMAGNLGMLTALDVASLYAFFAMMSFASYGLVIHARNEGAFAASRLYIAFVVIGELALFGGLALAANQSASLMLVDLRVTAPSDLAAALLLIGFGVKLGVMPLHFWLPPAHGAAPVPASAVLSGVMIKAGLFGMMSVLPLGVIALPTHGIVVMAAGLVSVFAAGIIGLSQTNPKAILGWSSVAQMGLIALGIGAALKAPEAWLLVGPALVFHAAHHALAKGALFLGAGVFGIAAALNRRWLGLLVLPIPMAALAGLAPFTGAVSKSDLKIAVAGGPVGWAPWLVLALTLSGVVTTLLLGRFLITLWRTPPAAPAPVIAAPGWVALPCVVLVGCSLLLVPIWPLAELGPVGSVWPKDWVEMWPVALGVVVATCGAIVGRARRMGPARLVAQVTAPARNLGARIAARALRVRRSLRMVARRVPQRIDGVTQDWRLGQAAMAAVVVIMILLEGPALVAGLLAR